MSASPEILRSDKDGLCVLTLNRPHKLNSLTVSLFEALLLQLEEIAISTATIGCVVLRAAGRCFSAGHDLADLEAGETAPVPQFQAHVIEKLQNLPMPVIAAVHSHCYTGALELALGADLIVATQNARFADTHAKWSLTPIWGLSQRLPRRVGIAKAREMMFTCRTYTAAEAERMGLVNLVVPDDSLDAEVEKMARMILEQSWFSHRALKKLLRETDGMPIGAGLAHEIYYGAGFGPDFQSRINAFLSKKNNAPGIPTV